MGLLQANGMDSGSAAAKRGGRKVALVVFAAACTGGMALFSTPALADFRVCNATQNLIGVAIGYRAKAGWVTEGWWHIEGSSC